MGPGRMTAPPGPAMRAEGMARQLTFDLPARPALGRDAFLVAPANALALKGLEEWQGWPLGRAVLSGPAGAGKTHLAHVWAGMTGARMAAAHDLPAADLPELAAHAGVIVEDADRIAGDRAAEDALFHLVNLCADSATPLLVTARVPASRWPLALPDLKSRLEAAAQLVLSPPDDALLSALLVKLFADRQLAVPPAVVTWLVGRIERSAEAAQRVVARLDRAALEARRPITRQLAAEVLERAQGELFPDEPGDMPGDGAR